jgi:hypothetical protein
MSRTLLQQSHFNHANVRHCQMGRKAMPGGYTSLCIDMLGSWPPLIRHPHPLSPFSERVSAFMATTLPFELLVAIFSEACLKVPIAKLPEDWRTPSDRSMSTALPEIYISTSHVALSAYSLVHSTWSSPAQHLLFGYTIIASPERWGLFLRRLPVSPHLRVLVHTLELRIHIIIDRSLVRILPRLLPSLEHLVFNADVKPSVSLLHILPTIKRIHTRPSQRSNQPFLSDEVYNTDTQLALQQLTIDNLSTQNSLLMWLRHTRTRERGTLRTLKLFAWTHQSSILDSANVVRRPYNPSLQVISPALNLGSKSVRKILEENGGIHHLTLTLNIDVEWSNELDPPARDPVVRSGPVFRHFAKTEDQTKRSGPVLRHC